MKADVILIWVIIMMLQRVRGNINLLLCDYFILYFILEKMGIT